MISIEANFDESSVTLSGDASAEEIAYLRIALAKAEKILRRAPSTNRIRIQVNGVNINLESQQSEKEIQGSVGVLKKFCVETFGY